MVLDLCIFLDRGERLVLDLTKTWAVNVVSVDFLLFICGLQEIITAEKEKLNRRQSLRLNDMGQISVTTCLLKG